MKIGEFNMNKHGGKDGGETDPSAVESEIKNHLLVQHWRKDFPILHTSLYGKPLVYFDNAATTQKPSIVIEAESYYYRHTNANVHRGIHTLSQQATEAFEAARSKLQRFINARHPHEVIFVHGTTEAINLVAQSYGRCRFKTGDEIIISAMEHHSNIVPWQMLCQQTGAILRIVPVNDAGELDINAYQNLFNPNTKLVAITHVSNTLGTINPVKSIIHYAHTQHVPVLLDGAQAIAHIAVDVQDLDCDFYAFSGHKLYGPTGIGVLYGKADLLEDMPPYQGGGDMISSVSFSATTYNKLPYKFEAGTPNIAGVVGLGAAVDYLSAIGMDTIIKHEQSLLNYATELIVNIPDIRMIGSATEKTGIISWVLAGMHPHDIGTFLDRQAIAVRTGHHCTMPLMERFGVPATVRASFALYNTKNEVDKLVNAIYQARELFK
ncbi:cysteine desulfurase [Methylotenera mobilis]|uniref:Cysteine desulfurase n=1 Tax=Methylotenera mobilis (strain JLW8 / ATCC BAA-1282 / DSM 17540) TaxID=583345 RepID=C6WVT4_METML|nr:cysteine desulfurase [Methylotenera mobilis]ACT48033.1 cysteine desulfurase, SufS subfamily [Methylotenera mobilis JLW8]